MEEKLRTSIEGFFTIRDKTTGEILVDKKNAVHYGNMSASMASSLAGIESGHIRYMAFGNGGTIIDGAGKITYRSPNVSNFKDISASLYNETFFIEIDQTDYNYVTPIPSTSTYADIKIKVTLDYIETGPLQDPVDIANDMNGYTVFDELAIYTGPVGITSPETMVGSDSLLVTHVTFHPIQKALNRILEVDYTLRIHLQ